jgi:hypothetical protein
VFIPGFGYVTHRKVLKCNLCVYPRVWLSYTQKNTEINVIFVVYPRVWLSYTQKNTEINVTFVFWVISVYFNIRNTLPKSGTFLLGHPV